ncbi:MAG: hypothetical protein RL095_2662 [Verrucomicrobiota bacterium]|jgi:hypothetical protein
MYLRLLQKLLARDERESHHVAALYRRDTRRNGAICWLIGGSLALLLMQVISRPQELLIFLCAAAFLLAHPFRALGRHQEEFAFTLPVPRRLYWQYDVATIVLPIAALSLFGTVVVSLDLAVKFWGLFLDGPWVMRREWWGESWHTPTIKSEEDELPLFHLLPVIFLPILLAACLALLHWVCRSVLMRLGLWIVLIAVMIGGRFDQIHGLDLSNVFFAWEWNLKGYIVREPAVLWSLLVAFPLLWWLADWFVDEREVSAASSEESLSAPSLPKPQWSRLGLGAARAWVGVILILLPVLALIHFHQKSRELWQERLAVRAQLDQGEVLLREPSVERRMNLQDLETFRDKSHLIQVVLRDEISGKIILAEEKKVNSGMYDISGLTLYAYGAEPSVFAWRQLPIDSCTYQACVTHRPIIHLYRDSDFTVIFREIGNNDGNVIVGRWTILTDDLLDPRFCQTPMRVSQGQSLWVRAMVLDDESSFMPKTAKECFASAEAFEKGREKAYWRKAYPELVFPGEWPCDQRRLLPMGEGENPDFDSSFRLSFGEIFIIASLIGFGLILGPRRLLWSLPLGGFLIVVGLALFEAKVGAEWKKEGIPVRDHFLKRSTGLASILPADRSRACCSRKEHGRPARGSDRRDACPPLPETHDQGAIS